MSLPWILQLFPWKMLDASVLLWFLLLFFNTILPYSSRIQKPQEAMRWRLLKHRYVTIHLKVKEDISESGNAAVCCGNCAKIGVSGSQNLLDRREAIRRMTISDIAVIVPHLFSWIILIAYWIYTLCSVCSAVLWFFSFECYRLKNNPSCLQALAKLSSSMVGLLVFAVVISAECSTSFADF